MKTTKRQPPHQHQYKQHPSWPTHIFCTVCGFAIVKNPRIWSTKSEQVKS